MEINMKVTYEDYITIYNRAIMDLSQQLIKSIRDDTCGCASDAKLIVVENMERLLKTK